MINSVGDRGTRGRFLFVMGSARAGTTAMTNLLNSRDDVIVGRERFGRSKRPTRAHFESGAFFEPTSSEAFTLRLDWYQEMRRKYEGGGVSLIGDKVPFYTRHLEWLESEFADPLYLFLLRDPRSVADSYERRRQDPEDHWRLGVGAALSGWNQSVRAAAEFIEESGSRRMAIIVYEWFFSGGTNHPRFLESFLGIGENPEFVKRHQRIRREPATFLSGWSNLQARQKRRIDEEAEWAAASLLRDVAAKQYAETVARSPLVGWAGQDAEIPSADHANVASRLICQTDARLEA